MKIAHYTNLETAMTYILPSQKLRFGPIYGTNDPYEGGIGWQVHELVNFNNILKETYDPNEIVRILNNKNNDLKKTKDSIGICCFDCDGETVKSGRNRHLWTYYASAKQGLNGGIALVFNQEKLLSRIIENENCTILYDGKIKYITTDEIKTLGERLDVVESLKHKDEFWRSECEYRIILSAKEPTKPPIEIAIGGCIEEIIIPVAYGKKLSSDFTGAIRKLCGAEVQIITRSYMLNYEDWSYIGPL